MLMEGRSSGGAAPYHLEIKVAPRRCHVPSGDNLRGRERGTAIYIQVPSGRCHA